MHRVAKFSPRVRARRKGLRRSKSITNYKKRLWDIFSEYIRKKYADDNGYVICVTCGAVEHWKKIQAGHYHARTAGMSLYFDERNVHPQCVGCNLWRRGNLTQYAIFLRKTYGPGILEELDEKRKELRKITAAEYLELIETYRARCKEIRLPEAA